MVDIRIEMSKYRCRCGLYDSNDDNPDSSVARDDRETYPKFADSSTNTDVPQQRWLS